MDKKYDVIPVPDRTLARICDAKARHDEALSDLKDLVKIAAECLGVPTGYAFYVESGCFVKEIASPKPEKGQIVH